MAEGERVPDDGERYEIQCSKCGELTGILVSYPPDILREATRIVVEREARDARD